VLAAAIPFVFLHPNYQPSVQVGRADVDLSDLAVLVVVLAALAGGRAAAASLRGARVAWVGLGALAVVVVAATLRGAAEPAYPLSTHAVSAAKWVEYMLLAPAAVALCRRPGSWRVPAAAILGWGCVAVVFALLQFADLAGDRIDHTPGGRRKPSFLGDHDLAALSAALLLYALIVLARRPRSVLERRLALAAGIAGVVGMVIGGAFDSYLGAILATVVLMLVLRPPGRRVALVAAVLAVVLVGLFGIRSQAVADGLKFLGLKQGNGGAGAHVQSYRQRALLAYIGGRIFLAHPLDGVGFAGSQDPFAYRPYVADARRHFVQPPEAFPSPEHPWGVQNAYVQAAADAGILGPLALLAALLAPPLLALRRGAGDLRLLGAGVGLLVLGTWNGYGLVPGLPVDALTWLGAGAAVASVTVEAGALRRYRSPVPDSLAGPSPA
jgi:hypothetical protein